MRTPFVGEIRMFAFGRTPIGWLTCDGSLLSIAQYVQLFQLIGTSYGGNGQTTFAVPDLRGRVPLSQGQGPGLSNRDLAEQAGAETVTFTTAQMPGHTHIAVATSAAATVDTPGPTVLPGAVSGDTLYTSDTTGLTPIKMSPSSISNDGAGQPHENCMPTLTVQYCIAYQGDFPSPA